MKETFYNFRMWLELNRGKDSNRASKLATRLRTIESLYSKYTDKGDNYLRSFYRNFQAAHNIKTGKFQIHEKFDNLIKEYQQIYDDLTKGTKPFDGITVGVRNEFKTAVREYLLFIAMMTGKLTEKDVYECCKTKRPDPYHEIVPPEIFKHGVFNALRKAKYVFTERESKFIAQTLDNFHSLMQAYLHEHDCKCEAKDMIIDTSFMRVQDININFDWRSIFVDALHLKVGDDFLPISNCCWFRITNGELAVSIEGTEHIFEIPHVSRLSSKTPKLLFLPSYTCDILQRQTYVDEILDICSGMNGCLKHIINNNHIDSFYDLMFEMEKYGNIRTLKELSHQAMRALQNYASNFIIQMGIETPIVVDFEVSDFEEADDHTTVRHYKH